ncbi:MAG: GTP cyclohydrolase I [Deltaproteobacteria bacterium]|nr:GTP cyclohydrolase I [Deltaproteobacteria bacterium]
MPRGSRRAIPPGRAIPRVRAPDRARAEDALRAFLDALGFDPADVELRDTPTRVTRAFIEVLTAGYAQDGLGVLGSGFTSQHRGSVVSTRIPLVFTCPHHLMMAHGQAHLAFLPNGKIPGLARLFRLVDAMSHRLILQEDLTHEISDALREMLSATAAVVVIEAKHGCIAVEDLARKDTIIRTTSSFGARRNVESLQHEIDVTLFEPWKTSASDAPSPSHGSKSPSPSPPRPAVRRKRRTNSK